MEVGVAPMRATGIFIALLLRYDAERKAISPQASE